MGRIFHGTRLPRALPALQLGGSERSGFLPSRAKTLK
jgi:hypothetical protein